MAKKVKLIERLSIVALDKDKKVVTISTMHDVHPKILAELQADFGREALIEALGDDERVPQIDRTYLVVTNNVESEDEGKK